ncbi:hypothetical protein SKAU_G00302590 [Synaphobranchus kaupii]|uniref:Uncharacterized protein n=1 Tax=Synaphobranchus kaupii TaxID=118154 RepID=A0A9Q1EW24_SYNKA|nr:hypothetical protein SKAU_G00302590 [Synaphobranchus kaupii]
MHGLSGCQGAWFPPAPLPSPLRLPEAKRLAPAPPSRLRQGRACHFGTDYHPKNPNRPTGVRAPLGPERPARRPGQGAPASGSGTPEVTEGHRADQIPGGLRRAPPVLQQGLFLTRRHSSGTAHTLMRPGTTKPFLFFSDGCPRNTPDAPGPI